MRNLVKLTSTLPAVPGNPESVDFVVVGIPDQEDGVNFIQIVEWGFFPFGGDPLHEITEIDITEKEK